MSVGYMYILQCSNDTYYVGSTKYLELRLSQHQNGEGANYTKKHLPVKLVYYEKYNRIDTAFYREKQVQGWSRKKKEALIRGEIEKLHEYAECQNESHFRNVPFDSAQGASFDSAGFDSAGFDSAGFDSAQPTEPRSLSEAERSLNVAETTSAGFDSAQPAEPRSLSEAKRSLSVTETTTENGR